METRVGWIIRWRCLVGRWRIPGLGSRGSPGWRLLAGEFVYPLDERLHEVRLNSGYRFKSLRFLLIDSRVPRDTKRLVAGVGAKKLAVSSRIADCMHRVWIVLIQFWRLGTGSRRQDPRFHPEHHG